MICDLKIDVWINIQLKEMIVSEVQLTQTEEVMHFYLKNDNETLGFEILI